ncbi:sigma-70 family RNA polymerase sigma factor [Candidatus Poribacteria bacterium]|nr:sigma-70 family RNA polymerase sigma factor [Candidatus Poribacteria bacterium]MYB00951.1 sigma-70 family RNA polymerase sigma factor [Candidatus Poribacteria bacterium]
MQSNDVTLIQQILNGDQNAFTALVKKYQKQIHAFAWRTLGDFHLAEEITQDTFLKVYQQLWTLRDPNRFGAWLHTIVRNCCLAYLRKTQQPIESLDTMPEAEMERVSYNQYLEKQREGVANETRDKVVKHLLNKLSENEQTVITLHYLGDMRCEEIGKFLDVPLNTIKSRLHRARKRLREEELMVRKTLGGFELPDNFTENIMEWIQMNEPGTRPVVNTLSVTSDKTLYAVIGDESIYKLPAGEETWRLVNSDFLRQDTHGSIPIAEHNGTLYIIPSHELFASTDEGATWHSIGPCPKGYTRELIITEETFYLCLDNGIFRSDNAGNSWTVMTEGLHDHLTEHAGIRSLRIHQSTLFAGTNRGIYRLNAGTWEHLQLPVDDIVSVDPVVVSEDHIYVAVSVNILEGDGTPQENFMPLWKGEKLSWWVFRSADGGDSWTDITPVEARDLMRVLPQITLLASEKTLLVIGKDSGMVVRSTDGGDTWTYIESSGITPMQFSVGSTLALTPNTFYTRGCTGIHRSTDGGQTWHRFNTRFESRVDGLVSFMARSASNKSPALYARVGPNLVKSIDEGRSWDAVNVASETDRPSHKENPPLIVQVVETDGVLHAKGIRGNSTAIFRLSNDGKVLSLPTEIPPSFNSAKLMGHVLGGRSFDFKDERQVGQGLIVTISSTIDPLSDELIQENPDFGAERFLKQLIQVQEDSALAYELIWEGLWGDFAVSGKTFYMEYNYKLFRWKPGETEWFYTGVEETIELSRDNVRRGFKIAVSGETVYVGKRDGHLWQSVDGGDSWNDVTSNLPLSVAHFKEIVFADSTLHVATDKGVFNSKDGIDWSLLIDKTGEPVIIKSLATAGDSVYGANTEGIYHLQSDTGTWEQVAPEISGNVTSLVVDENTFYVGTEHRGVLRFERSA